MILHTLGLVNSLANSLSLDAHFCPAVVQQTEPVACSLYERGPIWSSSKMGC